MSSNITESQVVKLWHQLLADRTELITEEGEPVEIIYPGRNNDDRGADFRDAVIASNSGLVKGDVEIHVKSSDWQSHRHHQDRAYDRVILHVVMWHNTATSLTKGSGIPVLALERHIRGQHNHWLEMEPPMALNLPCSKVRERLPQDTVARFLDDAGEQRFFARVSQYQKELAQIEAGETLYQGIMEALGYTKNKLPFRELARRLPLKALEAIAFRRLPKEEHLARLQALLLGTAGLLPSRCQTSQRDLDEKWRDRLGWLWAISENTQVMSPNDWHLFKVRPNNSPVRRLLAMSLLLLHYKGKGLLAGLINLVKEAPPERSYQQLESGLIVTLEAGSRRITLLGRTRASDIIVNVLLPFTSAWGGVTAQAELTGKALTLYHGYPQLATNAVDRHMIKQLGLNRSLVNSARRQQGLLHIYQTFCTQGECHGCPFR
jgi:hypothetical protein